MLDATVDRWSVLLFGDPGSIDDAQDVRSGNITSSTGTTSWTDVGLIAGFGVVTVVSALVAKGHVTRLDGRRAVTWRVAVPM